MLQASSPPISSSQVAADSQSGVGRMWKDLGSLVHDSLPFWRSYLLHLLYHEASHQVLEGVEVADGILYIIPQRPELLLSLLYAVPDREMHILLGRGEIPHILYGRFHLLEDLQLSFVSLVNSVPVLPHLGLIGLERIRRLLRHV